MEYKVKTRDGYILTVFRIPSVNLKKPPVFMLHGVQSSSGIYVGLGRSSLGKNPLNTICYKKKDKLIRAFFHLFHSVNNTYNLLIVLIFYIVENVNTMKVA